MRRQIFIPVLQEHPYFCFPESVGYYKNDPQHNVNREKEEFNYFNLHVVISGKGYLKSAGITYTLQQGDSFFYFPLEEQIYYSDKENPWEVLWVHFNGNHLKEFFIENGFRSTHVWTLKLWKSVSSSILDLLDEAEQFTILHPSTLSTLTYGIISEFISQAMALTANKGFDLYDRIISLLPKMKETSAKPFDLKLWADQLEISTFYFSKMFKEVAGMPPSKFITLCRLQKAKQLLIEKRQFTVKRIALETGYPSISYFGHIFMENEGISPAKYRKKFDLYNGVNHI